MERFISDVCTPAWNSRLDAGRSFAEAVAELAVLHPRHRELIEVYHTRWDEMLGGAIEGTVAILEELHNQGYYLCALSNWSAETFPFVRKRFQFPRLFRTIVLSGEERLLKPDPAIFQVLLRRIGRRAEDCLYIDDLPANTSVARGLGFGTIDFISPEDLRTQLRAQGFEL